MTAAETSARPAAPPIALLGLIVGSAVMGMTLLTPMFPLIRDDLSASSSAVQLLLTGYVIAIAAGQLFAGTLSDRFGRRPILLTGAMVFALSSGAAAMTPSIEALMVCRVVQGLGAAALVTAGRGIVSDCFERQQAARTMSTVQTIQAVVPMASLAGGGLLGELAGWQSGLALMSFCGLAAWLLSVWLVAETNRHPTSSINPAGVLVAYAAVLRNRVFGSFAMASGLAVGSFLTLNGILPYQYEKLGVSPLEFGLWFSLTPVFFFIGNALNRYYFVARGIERAAMIGCWGNLIAVTAMFATQAIGMSDPLSLALPGCLFGLANGIVVANTTVGAMTAAGRYAGTAAGLTGAWQMAAGGLAGSIIVALGGADDFLLASSALILMAAVGVLSILYVYRRRHELS